MEKANKSSSPLGEGNTDIITSMIDLEREYFAKFVFGK